jgi:hypothetical protein
MGRMAISLAGGRMTGSTRGMGLDDDASLGNPPGSIVASGAAGTNGFDHYIGNDFQADWSLC